MTSSLAKSVHDAIKTIYGEFRGSSLVPSLTEKVKIRMEDLVPKTQVSVDTLAIRKWEIKVSRGKDKVKATIEHHRGRLQFTVESELT